jgi:RES domain-containing protein
MRIWRISEFADLSGDGGKMYPGRWNMRNSPVVYCADHPSTALLEILVHLKPERMPSSYQLIEVTIEDRISIETPDLPENWQNNLAVTRALGTAKLRNNTAALLRVPSVIMPQAYNYLVNPAHPDAAAFRITQTWRYPFDSRLLI